jgi:hypothetical protein
MTARSPEGLYLPVMAGLALESGEWGAKLAMAGEVE